MKKIILFAALAIFAACNVKAQTTTPRFGTTKNSDQTYRRMNLGYVSVTDAAGLDSFRVNTNSFRTIYKVALVDSLMFASPTITNAYFGDELTFVISGTSGNKFKFSTVTTNFQGAGTATLSSGLNAILTFVFNGSKWVEKSRVVQ